MDQTRRLVWPRQWEKLFCVKCWVYIFSGSFGSPVHVRTRNNFFAGSYALYVNVDERKANNLYDVKSRVNNIALIYRLIINLVSVIRPKHSFKILAFILRLGKLHFSRDRVKNISTAEPNEPQNISTQHLTSYKLLLVLLSTTEPNEPLNIGTQD